MQALAAGTTGCPSSWRRFIELLGFVNRCGSLSRDLAATRLGLCQCRLKPQHSRELLLGREEVGNLLIAPKLFVPAAHEGGC